MKGGIRCVKAANRLFKKSLIIHTQLIGLLFQVIPVQQFVKWEKGGIRKSEKSCRHFHFLRKELDLLAELGIFFNIRLNFLAGMEHGAVVAATEGFADFVQ